jgi:hypothetical protein
VRHAVPAAHAGSDPTSAGNGGPVHPGARPYRLVRGPVEAQPHDSPAAGWGAANSATRGTRSEPSPCWCFLFILALYSCTVTTRTYGGLGSKDNRAICTCHLPRIRRRDRAIASRSKARARDAISAVPRGSDSLVTRLTNRLAMTTPFIVVSNSWPISARITWPRRRWHTGMDDWRTAGTLPERSGKAGQRASPRWWCRRPRRGASRQWPPWRSPRRRDRGAATRRTARLCLPRPPPQAPPRLPRPPPHRA